MSCADKRWNENFTTFLHDHNLTYVVEQGIEVCYVDNIPLDEFLEKNVSKHEFIRKNVLTATLNFNHRVKEFIKTIVMNKYSDMCVQFYNYRVEFQMRGAGHIHGVLWIDWKKMREKMNLKSRSKETAILNVDLIVRAFENIKDEVFEVLKMMQKKQL